jgi:pimeloyl-ACP methyl ester carboxylesterase
MTRKLLALLAAALVLTGLSATAAPAHQRHRDPRPVIFVHGFSGSGSQFETQARRLASNGYPAESIEAHEYDSLFAVNTVEQVFAALDQRIARLLARTGADRVDLLGHSLGTTLMQAYLRSSPQRAATVAHYVNLDGAASTSLPGGVPTLAVWGEGSTARTIVGATNVYFSGQAHTQVVTSRETFAEIYRFFTGRAPRTSDVVAQPPGRVFLSGRAVLFPSNVGVSNARLEVYEVHPSTGARKGWRPKAVFRLDGDGSWGPFRASGSAHYEFAIVREGAATHHLYYQPFRRTDRLIRLLTSVPGEGLAANVEVSDRHTAMVVNRQKEWWGDQGTGSDSLTIDGTQVLNAANSPRTKRVIGIFAYDAGVDQATDLTAPIPVFFAQPFITGMDVYVPANPPGRTIHVVARPRDGNGHVDTINIPNWRSSEHRVTVQFDDYVQKRHGHGPHR